MTIRINNVNIILVQNIEQRKEDYMTIFNYQKLRGRIVEIFRTQSIFAKELGISERSLSLKLNGRLAWRQQEICKAIDLLNLTKEDISVYFFTTKVQNVEPKQTA